MEGPQLYIVPYTAVASHVSQRADFHFNWSPQQVILLKGSSLLLEGVPNSR